MGGPAGPFQCSLPRCIDLEGTVLRWGLLIELAVVRLAPDPLAQFLPHWWLRQDKARLKREVARRVQLEPPNPPPDARMLELRPAIPRRHRVLSAASEAALAHAAAAHLGRFVEVMAGSSRAWVRALRLPRGIALARHLVLPPHLRAASGEDPVQHWHRHGRPEGRRCRPGGVTP